MSSGLDTSPATNRVSTGRSFASDVSASSLTSNKHRRIPRSAKRLAAARPMPLAAPVMTAVLPDPKSSLMFLPCALQLGLYRCGCRCRTSTILPGESVRYIASLHPRTLGPYEPLRWRLQVMGSGPQSQDVEHQPSTVADDLRIRRGPVRERSFGQPRYSARQGSRSGAALSQGHGPQIARVTPGRE